MYSSTNLVNALYFANIGTLGIIFIPFWANLFVQNVLNKKENKLNLLFFACLILLVFLLFNNGFYKEVTFRDWGNYPIAKALNLLNILFFCGLFYKIVIQLWVSFKNELGTEKLKLQYLLLGFGIGSFGFIDWIPNYLPNYYPLAFILSSSWVFIMAYAILRHRLMDIEVIIKKGIIYSALIAVIVGVYSGLLLFLQQLFQLTTGVNQWVSTIITAFAIAVGFKPLEAYITNLTERYFFRKKYDYQQTLKESSEAMNLLTDIDRLIRLTTRIVARRMKLEESSTLLYDEHHQRYLMKAAEGKSKELIGTTYSDNFELFKHLFATRKILIKDEVAQTLNNKLLLPEERKRLNTIRKEMEKLHAQICVPSIPRGKYMQNKLVAVFCLGEKKSGDMYTNEDIQLLTTLSNQAAVAVENAIMYSDLMNQYEELRTTKDQLVQSEKLASLGTMAAGIAHEIKNPLTSLQLFSTMMAERFDDHEFREKFTQIVPTEIERLNSIVSDLVSFAKPSSLTMEPLNLNEVIEKSIRLSEISFKKMKVKIIKELSNTPKVCADGQKLMQIFLNLMMNGSHAMEEKGSGTLTISTIFDAHSNTVKACVKDTGTGMSAEKLKKIFDPFYTTKEKGTGLGLAITRRIIDEHNGKIDVESEEGVGTTFTVSLPVSQ